MAFFTALLALLAFLILPTAPASAAKVEPWSYNGNITWKHPDGRKIRSRRIMTKFDNDSLSIFRSRDGRYHARFIYRDTAKLLDSRSRFFILDRRDHKTARRVYLEIDARAWPSKTGGGGYVVGQLTKGDFKTLRKYAGNLLGASYYSRKRGEANGRLRHYSFTGKGFLAALKRLTGVSSPALGESLSTAPGGSSGSSTSGSSSSSAATFVGFSPKWTSCSRPSLSNINSERRVDRLIRRTKSWLRCRERNEDTARRQMIEHYGKAGIKITYGKQSDGDYKYRWRANKQQNKVISASVEEINAYINRTTSFANRSRRAIERWDRRARRNNQRRSYTPPAYTPPTTYRPAPTYRPPVIIQRGVQ
jgi:hypothetical protein